MLTLQQHLATPEISLEAHVHARQIELGKALASRIAIYLDTNYWIMLRSAAAGTPRQSVDTDLLTLLRKLALDGSIFCPISESIFMELMKQDDARSRIATATLVDELGLGVALIDVQTRISTEIAYLLNIKNGTADLHPLEHLVWSKLSYVLGFVHPTGTAFDPPTELALQKAFFDHMWSSPFREMITTIGNPQIDDLTDLASVAEQLNVENAAHSAEARSFAQLYSAEARGLVDLCGGIAAEIIKSIVQKNGAPEDDRSEADRRRFENQCKQLLALALEKDRARDILRTLHIQACLYAAVRWDARRKLTANDLYDFNHASAALAYCDAFFTEKPLGALLVQKHLALDERYGCRVIVEPGEALGYLQDLPAMTAGS